MNKIRTVFAFGGPYLARYWQRLVAGVLLGIFFGLINASFVWATKTMFERLTPAKPAIQTPAKPMTSAPTLATRIKARAADLKQSIDEGLDPWLPRSGRPLDGLQIIGGLLLLPFLVALRGGIGYLSTYCLSWVSERAVNDLRVDILAKLNSLSLDFFNRSKMGDLLTRINGDTSALQRSLSLGFSDLVKEPISIICIFTALILVNAKLTLFTLCFFPLCIIPMVVLGRKVRKASGQARKATISQMSLLVEALSGIRVIKAFSLENEQLERFRATCKQMFHHGMKGVQARGLVNPIIEVVALTGMSGLLVYIAYSKIQIDDLIAFLTGIIMLFEPVKKLGAVHVLMEQTSIGVDRLINLLGEQPSIKESPTPKPFKEFKTGITFENVSFSYGDRLVLQNVSLNIPRGFKLGIAGESGAGKSTLVNLIMRFYDPVSGAIKIDGVDLKDIGFHDLRQNMALVSQEIVIFDQSVADNIACGRKGATREEIETAAKAAFAHDFIVKLPQGYDTVVGERGISLSVGQRQRLSIARAFVRRAPILLLDEATASLDSHAEMEVQAAIDKLEENKTVICVAHRFSTLADMNQIIVISHEGRIVEQGSFDELLRLGGIFAAMAKRQGLNPS